MTTKKTALSGVDVVLTAKHKHNGKDFDSGATINVTSRQREFLARKGKIVDDTKVPTAK